MSNNRRSFDEFEQDIYKNRNGLASPKDGAVFYTNDAREAAEAHVATRQTQGHDTVTLEHTAYGEKLDAELQPYWKKSKTREQVALPTIETASKQYAEQASGRVEVFCNGKEPRPGGVFSKVERDALLANEKVTHINGVSRERLASLNAEKTPEATQKMDELIADGDRQRDQRIEAQDRELERERARGREDAAWSKLDDKHGRQPVNWGDGKDKSGDLGPGPGGGRTR